MPPAASRSPSRSGRSICGRSADPSSALILGRFAALGQYVPGVDETVPVTDFEVQVRAGAVPGAAHEPDRIALIDGLATADVPLAGPDPTTKKKPSPQSFQPA